MSTATHEPQALEVDCDPARLDMDLIHAFLSTSYWSAGIPREVVERAVRNSLPFGMYEDGKQVGFARVITDRTTFAYLADVFVVQSHRGRGLGKHMVNAIMGHAELQGLRRWMLATRDAHSLYAQYGFTPLASPPRFMERHDPDVYSRKP
jgi:GNAT superfamily N-acetyltransferase